MSFVSNLIFLLSYTVRNKKQNLSLEETNELIEGYEEKSSELLDFLSEQIRIQELRLAGKGKL